MALAVAGALAVPFVFTTTLVRYYLKHSDYAPFHITLDRATLGPTGRLTLRNLLVHDIREHTGRPLLSVSAARIDFAWTQLGQRRVHLIDVDGLQLYLRAANDQPLSLLRLANPPDAPSSAVATAPASAPASAAASTPPFWFDELVITGSAHVEGFEAWTQFLPDSMKAGIPLKLHAQTTGNARQPTRDLALVLGDPEASDSAPALAARLSLKPDPDGDIDVTLSNVSLRRASVSLAPETIAKFLPRFAAAPADLRRRYDVSLDALQITGLLETGRDMRFTGDIDLRGLDIVARSEGTPLSLDSFALSVHVVAPFGEDFPKTLHVSGGTCTFEVLQGGPWRLSKATANFELSDEVFTLAQWQAGFAGGLMMGSLDWPINSGSPSRGSISIRDANSATVLARLPDDLRVQIPLTVDGPISAKLSFANEDPQRPAGRIELSTGDNLRLESARAAVLGPIVLKNAALTAELSWPDQLWSVPEVTRGSLRAEAISVIGLDLTDLSGTFLLNSGSLALDELHAALGTDGTLTAAARINTTTWSPDALALSATNIPGAAAASWLPPDVQLEGTLALTLACEHPETAPQDYAFTAALGLSDPYTMRVHDGKATAAGGLTINLTGSVGSDFHSNLSGTLKLEHLKSLTCDEALLAQLRPGQTPLFKGAADLGLDSLTLEGKVATTPTAFAGKLEFAGLDAHATLAGGSTLELENLALSGPLALPLDSPALPDLLAHSSANPLTLAFDHFGYGQNTLDDFTACLILDKGKLSVGPDAQCAFAGGTITAAAEVDLLRPALMSATLKLKQIDQAIISQNMLPERFSAEGIVDGEISITRDPRDHLVGSIELTSDTAGRLKLDRELSQKLLAPAARAAAIDAGATLPPSFDQIVTGQLANYPYTTGKLTARDSGEDLELMLNYTRVALTPGEPGYGVKVTVEGHDVLNNYPLHIKGLTLALAHYTVPEVLAKASGFAALIAEPHPPILATQPATATAPSAAPATAPATMPLTAPVTAPAAAPATAPSTRAATTLASSPPRPSATIPATTYPAAPRTATRPRP